MTTRLSWYTRLSRTQKVGGVLFVGLVVGANLLNLSTSRLLDRTTDSVAAAGPVFARAYGEFALRLRAVPLRGLTGETCSAARRYKR